MVATVTRTPIPEPDTATGNVELGISFFKELCVETKDEKGRWVNPQSARNESWDLFVMALAVSLILMFSASARAAARFEVSRAISMLIGSSESMPRLEWCDDRSFAFDPSFELALVHRLC